MIKILFLGSNSVQSVISFKILNNLVLCIHVMFEERGALLAIAMGG